MSSEEVAAKQQPPAPAAGEAQKPEPPRIEIMISDDNELLLSIPLDKVNRTFARGVIEDARDAVDGWYFKQAKLRQSLVQKSLPAQAREALAKMGRRIIQ